MSQPIQSSPGQQPPPPPLPPMPYFQAPDKRKRFGFLAMGIASAVALALGVGIGGATAGGGGAAGSAAPTATSGATASRSASPTMQRYATVIALRNAAEAAGYKCPNWQANADDGGPLHAQESGSCSDEDVFAVYASDGDLNDQEVLMRAGGVTPTLVGINWTIHSTTGEIPTLQRALGGHLIEEEAAPEPTEEPSEEPTKEPAAFNPKPADFRVTIKVTGKECFGSAGCIINFEANLSYKGSVNELPDDGVTSVTFEVTGGEDPFTDTLKVDGEGTVTGGDEQTIDTTSSSKKLVAKVTEVDYNEFG